jgi:hypothetical protein
MRGAFEDCKFDTLQIFKEALDSFYTDIINKNPEDSAILRKYEYARKYQYVYDVFKLLQLDTTNLYKQSYNKVVAKKRERQELLNDPNANDTYLAKLCGYIGDKRFIQPLIDILNKPFDIDSTSIEIVREIMTESLVRMHVEPYYSDYVKKRTLTMEQIKDENERLAFKLDDFVDVLGTQEAFLELSKYLLSNKPYSTDVIDYEDHAEYRHYPASQDAFYLIQDNIENKEVQEMMGRKIFSENPELIQPLYDWMQKNYGKYKIRRIW